ncbi:hypothetical protein Chor_010358 [Crotalus horridus]
MQADYHFEYTECDSSGSRWRVAIPNPGAECSSLPDPVRGKECTFSCASGEYLEMKNQVCSKCAEGTYSLGSGIKFDEWDDLPAGFSNVATYMDSILGSAESKADSCAKSSWTPRGNYIESNRDDCTVSLIYTVHLKKSGSIFFEYQYIDNNIFFEFFVREICALNQPYRIQNDQCQEMDSTSDKWVKLTDNGEWGSYSGWPTRLNAFPASWAPLATNQVPPCVKSVQETPTQKRGLGNALSVLKKHIIQMKDQANVWNAFLAQIKTFSRSILRVIGKEK